MNRLFKQAAASSRDAFNPPKKDVSTRYSVLLEILAENCRKVSNPCITQHVFFANPHRNIKVEELEMSLEASHEVNMHLNGEVEKLTLKVDILEEEKAAYEKHVRELALLLAKERLKGQSENTAQVQIFYASTLTFHVSVRFVFHANSSQAQLVQICALNQPEHSKHILVLSSSAC